MKHVVAAAIVCLLGTAGASAGTGALAGKLTAPNITKHSAEKTTTVSETAADACARGEKTVTVSRTEPRFFAGRMVPVRVEYQRPACN